MLYSVSVLIITCPCALGLAVPIVQVIAVLKLMKLGVLVKSSDALEKISQITDIVFDKTGTLTYGKPIWVNQDQFDSKILIILYSIASYSSHPLMKAITFANKEEKTYLDLDVIEEKGMGVRSFYQGKEIRVGNRTWCNISNQNQNDHYLETWLSYDNSQYRLLFKDVLRTEIIEVISILKHKKISIHILSGDRSNVTGNIAENLDVQNYFGDLKPLDKYLKIQAMQNSGKKVLMIGDGINDAPALKLANTSISPSNGIDLALNSADIIFQKDFFSLIDIINISKFYVALIKENFLLSFCYNIITIPIAMLGFVTPLIAAAVMSLSSLTVILNSMRLNFKNLKKNK